MSEDNRQETTAQRLARGEAARRRALGTNHVDRATTSMSPERAAFEHYLTGAAWADVWDDEQLDQPVRRLLTICLLAAGGHERQLEVHIRGARDAGIPASDVAAGLLHVAIYAGLPAANLGIAVLDGVYGPERERCDDRGPQPPPPTGGKITTTERPDTHE